MALAETAAAHAAVARNARRHQLTTLLIALSVALLEAADLHHQRLIRAYGRTAVFGMLESGISVPPSDVRARSAELIAQNGAHVAAASLVLPGDGFWVSAARSSPECMQTGRGACDSITRFLLAA